MSLHSFIPHGEGSLQLDALLVANNFTTPLILIKVSGWTLIKDIFMAHLVMWLVKWTWQHRQDMMMSLSIDAMIIQVHREELNVRRM